MTVGEKIQFYRKKIGLSQEELGQKMLVSRQTVSLWEMDKTLPTVDNLLRLKEIFSVSIDDILSEAEPTEEKIPDNTALITSAIHDMRAAFSNLCEVISAANGIDEYNAEMLRALISDIDCYKY